MTIKPLRHDEGYLRGWFLVETGNAKRAREMAKQHASGYTEHKLTANQLKFLSQIVNDRQRQAFSPTCDVLLRHGLVEERALPHYPRMHVATDKGREALTQARAEGW
jgi:hypothetical protein